MSTILKALRRLEQEKASQSDRPLTEAVANTPPVAVPRSNRPPWLIAAGAAFVAFAVTATVIFFVRDDPAPEQVATAQAPPAAAKRAAEARRPAAKQRPRRTPAKPAVRAQAPSALALPNAALASPDVKVIDRPLPAPMEEEAIEPITVPRREPPRPGAAPQRPATRREPQPQPQPEAAPPAETQAAPIAVAAARVELEPAPSPTPKAAATTQPKTQAKAPVAPPVQRVEPVETAKAAPAPKAEPPATKPVAAKPAVEPSAAPAAKSVAKPATAASPPPATPKLAPEASPPRPAAKPPTQVAAVVPVERSSPPPRPAVAATPKALEIAKAVPAEAREVLKTLPSPAASATARRAATPDVFVERTIWHPLADRRVAIASLGDDGESVELREGDSLGPLVVGEIEPTGVFFYHDGVELRRGIGAR